MFSLPIILSVLTALADRQPRKVLVVVDESLALAQPELSHQIESYFAAHSGAL